MLPEGDYWSVLLPGHNNNVRNYYYGGMRFPEKVCKHTHVSAHMDMAIDFFFSYGYGYRFPVCSVNDFWSSGGIP